MSSKKHYIELFHANVSFLYPPKGISTFSGGLEMEHWREKG